MFRSSVELGFCYPFGHRGREREREREICGNGTECALINAELTGCEEMRSVKICVWMMLELII